LPAPQSLTQNRRTLRINAVNLKNMLGYVQPDRRNLAHGWLPFPGDSSKHQFGTSMPQGGHPPHHSITSSARPDSGSGTVMPSVLAVLRLITNSLDQRSNQAQEFLLLRSFASRDEKGSDLNVGDLSA
jgi:hypothetical protein